MLLADSRTCLLCSAFHVVCKVPFCCKLQAALCFEGLRAASVLGQLYKHAHSALPTVLMSHDAIVAPTCLSFEMQPTLFQIWLDCDKPLLLNTGGSIESIAEAKAGIMRPNRPVVIAKQPYPQALQVLEQHAKQLNCQVVHPRDSIELVPKQTSQEGSTWVQTVTANPHRLAWMQPTGQAILHTSAITAIL